MKTTSTPVPRLRTALANLPRVELLLLLVLLLVGVLIRAAFLREPMRFDEAFTFQVYALRDLHGITLTYDTPNNHVFHTLLMHFSVEALGDRLLGIRLPAFVAGALVPLATWWAALELYGRQAALWAASLAVTASPLVDYSANGRGYTLSVLFVAVCLALAARIDRTASPWAMRGFVLAGALAVWSVPTSAYGLAVVGVWLAGAALLSGEEERRSKLLRASGALLLTGLLAALLLWPLTSQGGWNFVGGLPKTWEAISGLATDTVGFWHRTWFHPFDWIVMLGFVASLVLHRRLARSPMPLHAAFVLALGALLLTTRLGPFPRSWIALLPFYLIPAGAGISALVQMVVGRLGARGLPRPQLAALALLVVFTAVLSLSAFRSDPAESEAVPQSDNNIAGYLMSFKGGVPALMDYNSFAGPTDYYLRRFEYPVGVGLVQPAHRRRRSALTIVARNDAAGARGLVSRTGGIVTGPPRVAKHFEYISVYEVPIKRQAPKN